MPSVARLEGLLDTLRLPKVRDRRAVPALAALGAVASAVVVAAWALSSRLPATAAFPRQAADVGTKGIESRLAAVTERLEADPENLDALVEAGALHYLKGEAYYRTAVNELEEAWQLGAAQPRIFYYLGAIYQAEGLLPFAIKHYQRFVRNVPDDRETRLRLGRLLYQTGRHEDAVVQFQSLKTARGATDPVIEENLGLSLLALKRFGEAAGSFERLVDQPDFQGRARYYLGLCDFEQGRFAQARAQFAQAAARVQAGLPGVEPTSFWAAQAANDEKLEDWAGAKASWEQVLKLDPKSPKAKASLQKVLPKVRAAERAAALKAAAAAKAAPATAKPTTRK